MATKESAIQRKIIKYLEQEGAYVVKVVSANKSGVPDIIGCFEGLFFAIEVKTPETKGNISPLQEHNINKVEESFGTAIVAWELSQVETMLEGLR